MSDPHGESYANEGAAPAEPGTPQQPRSRGPSAPPEPEFTFPERIGPLTDKTRPDMDDLQQSLTKAGVINAFAKKYEDADGRLVLLYGGNGRHSPYAGWDADQILDDVLQAAADPAKGHPAGAHR